ncbi:MAG: F-box protein [Nitrososphaerota archaeon]
MSMESKINILDLPQEVIFFLLKKCEFKSICILMQTCTQLKHLVLSIPGYKDVLMIDDVETFYVRLLELRINNKKKLFCAARFLQKITWRHERKFTRVECYKLCSFALEYKSFGDLATDIVIGALKEIRNDNEISGILQKKSSISRRIMEGALYHPYNHIIRDYAWSIRHKIEDFL